MPNALVCPIHTAALDAPEAIAWLDADGPVSYAALDTRIGAVAGALRAKGAFREGKWAAFVIVPCSAHVAALFAWGRLGVPVLLLSPKFPETYRRELIENIPHFPANALVETACRLNVTSDVLATESAFPEEVPFAGVFTSGSSGRPKAAVLSRANLLASAHTANAWLGVSPGDTWLMSLPLHHVSGLGVVFRCVAARATMVFPSERESLAESIVRIRPAFLSLVATQLVRLLEVPAARAALRAAKAILLGGGPMPEGLAARALAEGLPIVASYGMTETAALIAATRPGDTGALDGSGMPLTPDTVRIGADGGIQVRGGSVFLGYLENGAIRRPPMPGGWFDTGDLGAFDAAGQLHVRGRRGAMFISGGENIHPETIEAVLRAIPGIAAAAVAPAPDAEYGHVPVAFVQWQAGVTLGEEKLSAALRAKLPGYMIPKRFHPWPNEERQVLGGKIDRAALRERARKLHG